jgi:hypothetical protein
MLFVYLARGEGEDLQYQYHAYCDTSQFEIGEEDADYKDYQLLLPLHNDVLVQCLLATYGLKLHRAIPPTRSRKRFIFVVRAVQNLAVG